MTTHNSRRRTVLKTGAWTAPAIIASASIPAYAASTSTLTDLAIELGQPTIDWDTFEPVYDTPIYRGTTGTRAHSHGSLPQTMTITNVSSVPAVNPSGSLLTQMKDVGTDVNSWALIGTQVNSTDPLVTFTYTGQGTPNGPTYLWTYAGTLQPGQSIEIPLRYYVTYPFANVDYELFVAVTVNDETQGDYDDNSELMGRVKGFAIYW